MMQGREVSAREYRSMPWYDRLPVAKFALLLVFISVFGLFMFVKRRG
jgi:hypothetical protein